jgi:hypothetical protein
MTDNADSADRGARIRRRTLLAGAVAVGGPLLFASYGRFAVGAEFEKHVADVLGIELDTAERLIQYARDTLDSVEYDVRASAFLAATTFPGADLIPRKQRERAIQPFLEHIMDRPVDNMIYLGLQKPSTGDACAGLLRST